MAIQEIVKELKSLKPLTWWCGSHQLGLSWCEEEDSGFSTSYLSVTKVIEDGGQLLGACVLTLGSRVGISPVHRQSMEPHFSVLQMRLLQTGIKAVNLTPWPGKGTLQGPVIDTQPEAHTGQDKKGWVKSQNWVMDLYFFGISPIA